MFVLLSLVLLQAPADQSGEPLTTALAIRELSPAAAAKRRIKIEGVVTHANPGINDFFVQDESAGIYVMPSGHGAGLTAGDQVEVEGFSNPGTFCPCVVATGVRRLGRKPLPEPEITDLRLRERNWLDGQYVQVWLYIRDVHFSQDFIHMPAATAYGIAVLVIPGAEDRSLRELKGQAIRVRGVCAVAHDPEQRLAGNHVRIFVQSPAILKAVPHSPVSQEPIRIIECLRGFSHVPMSSARPISIAGVVTARIDGEMLTIQDATGGAIVSLASTPHGEVGDQVVATGFLIPQRAGVRLLHATTRRSGAGTLPEAVATTASQALAEKRFGQRVRVEGVFDKAIAQEQNLTLYVNDGPTRFLVTLTSPDAPAAPPDFPEGSHIAVTGVAVPAVDEAEDAAQGLRVHAGSLEAVQLLRLPPPASWWTADRVGWLGIGFLGVLVLGGLWVWLLRRQLAKQATVITTHFQREADLADSLRQSRKLEAIGRLAGGIAHDFNNLLTVILGNSTLAADTLEREHPAQEHIQAIDDASERAADLTRQLLSFSRQQAVSLIPLDLNAAVSDAENLLRRLIGEHIALTVTRAPSLPRVLADATLIHQILLNLAANASDAMPKGGKLHIRTSLEKKPGKLVRLSVTDTGCGMSPETQSRIFEPFFTTKEVGKGTGLGLATVYGAVKTLQGTIQVQSVVNQGTTFTIDLPLHTLADAPDTPPPPPRPRGNRAVVMLVDDDTGVRQMCRKALEMYGYNVLACDSPAAALELLRTTTPPIALLVTDIVMPKMNGLELADASRAIKPGLRVLYMSGYPDDEVARMAGDIGGIEIIHKPFTPLQLATRVHELLDENAVASSAIQRPANGSP